MSVRLRPLLAAAASQSSGVLLADAADRGFAADDDGPLITGVTHDSRQVHPGSLFCCVRGAVVDGHRFAADAVRAGAAALLCDHPVGSGIAEVQVTDTRRAMAPIAAAFHGNPSHALRVVGVTGTNGKTTTVRMIQTILERGGVPTGVIGTLTGARTTPEATDLQQILADMRDRGVRTVAMEVSSHALALHRIDATQFAAVAFTNLSRDHLDFHGTMEEYFKAKASLFTPQFSAFAVIDVDSPNGKLLAATTEVATVVRTGASRVEIVSLGIDGTRYRWRGVDVFLPLPGRFNVSNAVVASEVCAGLGVEPALVGEALAAMGSIPGRFQRVDVGAPFTVVVDYAHTPDGLDNLLGAAREIAGNARVLVVFGCGGDRDATKRPFMGRVAREGADYVVVTSDNPRSEDPARIAAAIVAGMPERPEAIELDRRRAIRLAIGAARPGDIVVLAGKGHETTQQIGARSEPFDDATVAAEETASLRTAGQV